MGLQELPVIGEAELNAEVEQTKTMTEQFHCMEMDKGLGQLEAYAGETEGVAFKTDDDMFWCSVNDRIFGIQAVDEKVYECKFFVKITGPGKVVLRDCRGWFLAPKLLSVCCPIYPLQRMYRNWEASSEFNVFHKGNKVAFQTHDGSFLTKVFRGVFIVEAFKNSVDSSCFFQPEIGTLNPPEYTFENVTLGDISHLKCRPCILKKDTFVNQSRKPLSHTFTLTWEEEGVQITAWPCRWGLGLTTEAEFTIEGMEAVIKYNQDNDQVVFVPQRISQTIIEEVELPPRTKATARLVVHKQNDAAVPFLARIRKMSSDGTENNLLQPGVWKGLVYHSLKVEVQFEPLGLACTVM